MKKLTALFAALFLTMIGGTFISCSEDDELLAPKNTWVKKNFQYDDTDLTCYFMFTTSGYTNSSLKNVPESSQNGSTTSIKSGLTVVVVPSSSGTITGFLTKDKFICKTFGLGENSIGDNGEEESGGLSFTMSETKWNVFYYANITDFLNSQSKTPPEALTKSSYSEFTDFTQFSWQKALRNWLLNALED